MLFYKGLYWFYHLQGKQFKNPLILTPGVNEGQQMQARGMWNLAGVRIKGSRVLYMFSQMMEIRTWEYWNCQICQNLEKACLMQQMSWCNGGGERHQSGSNQSCWWKGCTQSSSQEIGNQVFKHLIQPWTIIKEMDRVTR